MYFFYISDLCRWQRLHWTVALFSEHVTPLLTDSMFISLVFWRCFLLVRYPIIMHHKMEKKKKKLKIWEKPEKKRKKLRKRRVFGKNRRKNWREWGGVLCQRRNSDDVGKIVTSFACSGWLKRPVCFLICLPLLSDLNIVHIKKNPMNIILV